MRNLIGIAVMGLVMTRAGVGWGQEAGTGPAVGKLEDILSAGELEGVEKQRAQAEVKGESLKITVERSGDYGKVEIYYLGEEREAAGRKVRRAAQHPSAVVYTVEVKRYAELKRHLDTRELKGLLAEMKRVKEAGAMVKRVTVKRGLFDIGTGTPEEFLGERGKYYDSREGRPRFETWPAGYRRATGLLSVSVTHTTIGRGPTSLEQAKRVEGKQFFGYLFPVLEEVLTEKQKAQAAEDLRRSNEVGGAATVKVEGVKDLGTVELIYLVREGKTGSRPTAMVAQVKLKGSEIAAEPAVLKAYLPPEGAERILKEIREEGKKPGRKLVGVEITKMYLDVVSGREGAARGALGEFKREITKYCGDGELVNARDWPERFRQADGTFDVEMSPTRVIWMDEGE